MMNKFLILTILLFGYQYSNAQCAACAKDNTCASKKPTGGLCKGDMTGMVGHVYDKDVTFYMPKKINCAAIGMGSSCTYVDLKQIKIASIFTPPGLSYTSDKTTYNVTGGDTMGCVKLCGTPISSGMFVLTINLLANITAHGTAAGDVDLSDQSFVYKDTIYILADTTSNPPLTSFNYVSNGIRKNTSVIKVCDSLNIDSLTALIPADCNLVSYKWDVKSKGNYTGSMPSTGLMTFKTPDTFTVKLTTQLYNYRIKNVLIGSVNGGYREFACIAAMEECLVGTAKPDVYITIDVAAYNNRRNCGNTNCGPNNEMNSNIAYNNLNLSIPSNKCANPFKLTLYDEDSAPYGTTLGFPESLGATADDKLDEFMITPVIGTSPSKNGSNTGNVRVVFDTIPAGPPIVETLTLIVNPTVAPVNINASSDSACKGQTITLNIPSTTNFIEWYMDTTIIPGENKDSITLTKTGSYKTVIYNAFGCSYTTTAKTTTFLTAPEAQIFSFKDTISIVGYDTTKFMYDWYKDTVMMPEMHNIKSKFITNTGFYKVKAYNKFCYSISDPAYIFKKSAIENFNVLPLTLFPNPIENGMLNIKNPTHARLNYTIKDVMGRSHSIGYFENEINSIDVSELSNDMYFIELVSDQQEMNIIKFIKK